jgi:hypothetical protein
MERRQRAAVSSFRERKPTPHPSKHSGNVFFMNGGIFLNFFSHCFLCPSDSTVSEDGGYCAVNSWSNELTKETTELVQHFRLFMGSSHRRKSSFGRCVPWTTRHLSETSLERYVPKTSRHWLMCPNFLPLVGTYRTSHYEGNSTL